MSKNNFVMNKVNRVKRSFASRIKRQYFKPSMDGNFIEKTYVNGEELATQKSEMKLLRFTKWNKINHSNRTNSSLPNDFRNEQQMTVTSLGLALVALFDQLKGTLCDMIKYDCSKLSV